MEESESMLENLSSVDLEKADSDSDFFHEKVPNSTCFIILTQNCKACRINSDLLLLKNELNALKESNEKEDICVETKSISE